MGIEIICETCGSTNIARDAWASWDTANQQWELGVVFDYAYCHDCDAETRLIERPQSTSSHST